MFWQVRELAISKKSALLNHFKAYSKKNIGNQVLIVKEFEENIQRNLGNTSDLCYTLPKINNELQIN